MEIKIYFHQKTFFTEKSYRVWINLKNKIVIQKLVGKRILKNKNYC